MQKEEKKNETKKRRIAYKNVFIHFRNRSRKCSLFLLHFFTNLLPVIKRRKYLYCFEWFLLYHLLHLFSPDCFTALTSTFFFFLNMWIFKNQPPRRVSCNVNLSNLGNVLERNLRTKSARECIFRASGSTNFETFTARRQLW